MPNYIETPTYAIKSMSVVRGNPKLGEFVELAFRHGSKRTGFHLTYAEARVLVEHVTGVMAGTHGRGVCGADQFLVGKEDEPMPDDPAAVAAEVMESEKIPAKRRFSDDDMMFYRTAAPVLAREVQRLRPYEQAVRRAHNGYDPEARDAMPLLKEPVSPKAAIDELLRMADEDGEAAGKAMAEAEIKRLRAALPDALAAIDEAYIATGHIKVAETSVQRERIVVALTAKPETGDPDAERN